jgi:hypothetical protein
MEMGNEDSRHITDLVTHSPQISNTISPRVHNIKLIARNYRNAGSGSIWRRHRPASTTERNMQSVVECSEDVPIYPGVNTTLHHCFQNGRTLGIDASNNYQYRD